MSDTDLSGRIRQRREQLGLSQEELASRMGYRSKSSITKLEKGINDLPRAKLEELAAALNTTPAWLMGLVDLLSPPGRRSSGRAARWSSPASSKVFRPHSA